MAEQHDRFEPEKGSLATMKVDAHGPPDGQPFDGRFGEKFDDEIHVPAVVWVTVGIAVVTALGFLTSWWLYRGLVAETAERPPEVPEIAREFPERRLPSGPRLQSSPEADLQELRRELGERLEGWGWVDEEAGLVHLPIDTAIDLVVESGLPQADPFPVSASEAPAVVEEETP